MSYKFCLKNTTNCINCSVHIKRATSILPIFIISNYFSIKVFTLTGGFTNFDGYLSSVEVWNGTSFNYATDMPFDSAWSCVAAVNSTHYIISGGFNSNLDYLRTVAISDGFEYTILPLMPEER